jgi:hypothetical protein
MQPMVEISIIRQYVLVVEENFVTRGNEYRRDEIANQNPHLVPKQIMVFAASISALYTQITLLCPHKFYKTTASIQKHEQFDRKINIFMKLSQGIQPTYPKLIIELKAFPRQTPAAPRQQYSCYQWIE